MILKFLLIIATLLQLVNAETVFEDIISPLGIAIIEKDTVKAVKLIEDGFNVRTYENRDSMKKILTPNVTTTYIGGMESKVYPIVILAAVNGEDEIIQAISLKDKEAVYLKDLDGNDALMWASRKGHLSTVKLLLEYGFDPLYETPKFQESAYELALSKHRYEILELFIAKLIEQKRTEVLSYTIWRLARGDSKTIEKLLKFGVKDTYKGYAPRTSLMKAAEVGKLDTVKLLLKYGSDPYEENEGNVRYGYDPLTAAITSGKDNVVRYLLQNYEYDLSKKFEGDNYLHLAVDHYIKLDNELFLLLVEKSKLDINSLSHSGRSLLDKIIDGRTIVVKDKNLQDIKFLLSLNFSKEVLEKALSRAKNYKEVYSLIEKKLK